MLNYLFTDWYCDRCYALAAADADGDGSVDMVAALKDDRTNAQLTIRKYFQFIVYVYYYLFIFL